MQTKRFTYVCTFSKNYGVHVDAISTIKKRKQLFFQKSNLRIQHSKMDSVFLRQNETYDGFFNRCNNNTHFDCTEEEMLWWMMGSKRLPLKEIIPLSVLLIVIFLTGAVGNICVCLLIVRHPGLHTATNYYLFSLAVSDLLLLLFGKL